MPQSLDVADIYDGPPSAFPNGCHIAEVEVDPDTGMTEVVKYTFVNDFGVVINPLLVDGQAHGGIVQGIGQALRESTVYDEDGQLLTGSYMDYAMPRAEDAPLFRHASHPVPATTNPLGAKGCGEAGCAGALPSVMNALVDALAEYGIQPHRHAGDAGAGVAGDPRGAGGVTLPSPPLLVISDRSQATRPLVEIAEAAFRGGCRWFSLREKDLPADERRELLRALVVLGHAYGATVMVHEDIAAAVATGAGGVHLPGGGDPKAARLLLPSGLIGVSAHSPLEAAAQLAAGADYATLSPIFLTRSKPGYGPAVGLDALERGGAARPRPGRRARRYRRGQSCRLSRFGRARHRGDGRDHARRRSRGSNPQPARRLPFALRVRLARERVEEPCSLRSAGRLIVAERQGSPDVQRCGARQRTEMQARTYIVTAALLLAGAAPASAQIPMAFLRIRAASDRFRPVASYQYPPILPVMAIRSCRLSCPT